MKTILEYLDMQAALRPEKAAFCDETYIIPSVSQSTGPTIPFIGNSKRA